MRRTGRRLFALILTLAAVSTACQSDVDKCVAAGMRSWEEDQAKLSEYLETGRQFSLVESPRLRGQVWEYTIRDHVAQRTMKVEQSEFQTDQQMLEYFNSFEGRRWAEKTFGDRPPVSRWETPADAEFYFRTRCMGASK